MESKIYNFVSTNSKHMMKTELATIFLITRKYVEKFIVSLYFHCNDLIIS